MADNFGNGLDRFQLSCRAWPVLTVCVKAKVRLWLKADVLRAVEFRPLYPRKRTFRGPRWTSACDPKEKCVVSQETEFWSLTTLREKLVKSGAKLVRHGCDVTFQLAEIAVPRNLFREILRRINELRRRPAPA